MIRLAPFSAVVFDMDGTLLDTEMVFRDVFYEVISGMGLSLDDNIYAHIVGTSHEVTHGILANAFGAHFSYQDFDAECRRIMGERMETAVPVRPGVPELLGELAARGIPAAVATSSRRVHALAHLGTAGILDRFRTVVARDDVNAPKPHPEPYLTAAKRLGVAPADCLAIEDSPTGVMSAHGAGMQTVMVPDIVKPTADIAALCVAVMDSLHDLRSAAFGRHMTASA